MANGSYVPLPNTAPLAVCLVGVGTVMAVSLHLLLDTANRLLALHDGLTDLVLYPSKAIWWILPIFLGMGTSCDITLKLWSVFSRPQAHAYRAVSSVKAGFDTTVALRWMTLALGLPGAVATILALPIHTTLTPTEIRDGHFATLRQTIYPYSQATSLTEFEGNAARDGSFTRRAGILIRFHDGRTFNTADTDDPKSSVDPLLRELLIRKTGLQIQHVRIQP